MVDAALKAVEADGYEQLTIRSLAAALNISPMAIYHYVRDKDDLLGEVVDRLLAPVWEPTTSRTDWQQWIFAAADRLHRFLVEQPAAMHVYLTHPVTSTSAMTRMQAMLAVLSDALGDDQRAQRAYAAIHTYTIGFAALESSRDHPTLEPDAEKTAVTSELASYTAPEQFEAGLRYLIRGIVSTRDGVPFVCA